MLAESSVSFEIRQVNDPVKIKKEITWSTLSWADMTYLMRSGLTRLCNGCGVDSAVAADRGGHSFAHPDHSSDYLSDPAPSPGPEGESEAAACSKSLITSPARISPATDGT